MNGSNLSPLEVQWVLVLVTAVCLMVDIAVVACFFYVFKKTCHEQCRRMELTCDEAIEKLTESDEKFFARRGG